MSGATVIGFYKLAKKEGLENASMAKTAEIIDMNPSLIVHYFKTKEYLVYGLIEYILDTANLLDIRRCPSNGSGTNGCSR